MPAGDAAMPLTRQDSQMSKEKLIRLFIVGGLVILADQITKLFILKTFLVGEIISVIPGFFNITHVHNPGGAFGLFADQSQMVRVIVFLVISTIAVGFILWMYRSIPKTHPMLANALALIFGGAVGNLIDRIRMGKVVDFLDCYIGQMHWPAFNVADSAICIGVGIFIFHILFKQMPEEMV